MKKCLLTEKAPRAGGSSERTKNSDKMKKQTTFGQLEDQDRFVILDMVDVEESLVWQKFSGRVANSKSEDEEWLALDESVTVRKV